MAIPEDRRTPLEAALVEGLKDVKHVGDYGVLWLNPPAKRVHLTMGDSDGDTEQGLTGFDEIAALVWKAVKPFWPEWLPPENGVFYEHDGSLVIADEWSPGDPDGGAAGWVEVGPVGREITVFDTLPDVWSKMLRAGSVTPAEWAFSKEVRLRVAHEMERQSRALTRAAMELVRPLVQNVEGRHPYYGPEHATPEAGRQAAVAAIMALSDEGKITSAQRDHLREAFNAKGVH